MQDQTAVKNVELGRVSSEDNEADLGTKYLDKDRIKKCVTKMEMLFARAWAGEQLPMVSGTGVIIGEKLIEGQSCLIGVVLFVTVGVVLLSCACIVFFTPANCRKCDERTRGCKATDLHESEEHASR